MSILACLYLFELGNLLTWPCTNGFSIYYITLSLGWMLFWERYSSIVNWPDHINLFVDIQWRQKGSMREGLYVVFWIKGRNWYFSRCTNNLPTSTTTLGLAFSQTPSIRKATNRFKSLPSEQKQPYHAAEDHSKQ